MAITKDQFSQIPSSGEIPSDKVPASQWAVGWTFLYFGYPSLTTFNHTFTGTIVLRVTDGSGINTKYWIKIQQTYNLFIIPLAPGLVLQTWNWVPSAEIIDARIGPPNEDGTHTGPKMRTLGLGTFGVTPADGTGTTNGEVIVDSTFYSGIFTEPLASGDKLVIDSHTLGSGYVVREANMLLATDPVSSYVASEFDLFGGLIAARPAGNGIQPGRSWPGHRYFEAGMPIRLSSGSAGVPSLCALRNGRVIQGVLHKDGYWEYESLTGEAGWSKVLYPQTDGSRAALPLFSSDITMPRIIALNNNTRLALANSDGEILVRQATDGAGPGELVKVMDAEPDGVYDLIQASSGTVYLVDGSGLPVRVSRNAGLPPWEVPSEAVTV